MGYTAPLTVITGDLATAAQYNTYTKDNLVALAAGYLGLPSQAALDFLYASSATQMARLAAGAALKRPSIDAAGTGWEFAWDKVVQIVAATYATETASSSTSYADTGLTAAITPKSTSNQVLVIVCQAGCYKSGADVNQGLKLQLLRGVTVLDIFETAGGFNNSTTIASFGTCALVYLDAPASISAQTYKTQLAAGQAAASVAVQNSSAR